jgi:hypothetical protein
VESLFVWLWHGAMLVYAWPLIKFWWNDDLASGRGSPLARARLQVLVSVLMPVVSWVWLFPMAAEFRKHRKREAARALLQAQQEARRQDVEFWRERLHSDHPVEAQLAEQLLQLWDVEQVDLPLVTQVAQTASDEAFRLAWDRVLRDRVESAAVPWPLLYVQAEYAEHDPSQRLVRVYDGARWIAVTEEQYEEWYRLNYHVMRAIDGGLDTHTRRG